MGRQRVKSESPHSFASDPRAFRLWIANPGQFRHWLRRHPFGRDIAVVLLAKVALLAAIKFAFFNRPVAEHMRLPPNEVARALLSPQIAQQEGARHAQ
ncbi:cytochrome oxidase putative small subunit CydP [Pandoraea thiooxydans]|uniref:cytochrome oxidase putative small subunit CydP n=1 Tax=Pandoraea thiooxydans TaxID=445709 RepID=UPI000932BFBE